MQADGMLEQGLLSAKQDRTSVTLFDGHVFVKPTNDWPAYLVEAM
jgi:hypothetical protein